MTPLAVFRRTLPDNETLAATSASDLLHLLQRDGARAFSSPRLQAVAQQVIQEVGIIANLTAAPGTFQLAPHLVTKCDHTVIKDPPPNVEDAIPSLLHSPRFHDLRQYCKTRHHQRWPTCPPRTVPGLTIDQLYIAVLTTSRLVASRGGVNAHVLRRQGARYGFYSDAPHHGVRELPVTGRLERFVHNRNLKHSSVRFIAQKHLELLHTLADESRQQHSSPSSSSSRQIRWWIVSDDDSFIFTGRLLDILRHLPDKEALFLGGARARAHLCADGLCNYKDYVKHHGRPPVMHAFAGGVGYVFSDAGLRRIGKAITDGHCLDAPYGDIATAACAQIANVTMLTLPGGWMVNDASIITTLRRQELAKNRSTSARGSAALWHQITTRPHFSGQLISTHKLTDRQALCWAEYGECSPRCDCICSCAEALAGAAPHRVKGNRSMIGMAMPKPFCREQPHSSCNFLCPTLAQLTAAFTSGDTSAVSASGGALTVERQLRETPVCRKHT